MKTTLLEQLVAEALGDIGEVKKALEELRVDLPLACREATVNVSDGVKQDLATGINGLVAAVSQTRVITGELAAYELSAKKRLDEHLHKGSARELTYMTNALDQLGQSLVRKIQTELEQVSPHQISQRFITGIFVLFFVMFFAGFALGSTAVNRTTFLTRAEVRQLELGRRVEAVLPRLSPAVVKALVNEPAQ